MEELALTEMIDEGLGVLWKASNLHTGGGEGGGEEIRVNSPRLSNHAWTLPDIEVGIAYTANSKIISSRQDGYAMRKGALPPHILLEGCLRWEG